MLFARFIYRKDGRRIAVFRPRSQDSAALRMAALGMPAGAICAALKMKRARLAELLAAPAGSIWGAQAKLLAEEMGRAA